MRRTSQDWIFKAALERLKEPPARMPRWTGGLDAVLVDPEAPLKPRLWLRCGRHVAPDLARALRRVAAGIVLVSPPRHEVRLVVVPCVALDSGDGKSAHGLFATPEEGPDEVASVGMAVASGFYEEAYMSRARVAAEVAQVLGHEYAHYEQWRDGRPVTERGVEVRGRGLVAAALKAAPRKIP